MKILQIRGKNEGVVHQSNGRDLQVHRADAHAAPAKLLEAVGRGVVEGENGPSAQELVQLDKFSVWFDLPP